MKKSLALLLSLCMVFCLVACGEATQTNTDISGSIAHTETSNDTTQTETADSQTEEISTTEKIQTSLTENSDNTSTSTESDNSIETNNQNTLTEADIRKIVQEELKNSNPDNSNTLTKDDVFKIVQEELKNFKPNNSNNLTKDDVSKIVQDELAKKEQNNNTNTLTEDAIRKIVQEEISKTVNVEEITKTVLAAIEEDNKFVPGEVLTCPQGNNFTMPIGFMADQTATITSFKVTALKVADINDKNDYDTSAYPGAFYGDYYPYIYQIEVSGKTDPSLAGKSLRVFVSFYGINISAYGDNDYMTINTDGTFSFKGRIGSNKVEKDVYVVAIRYKY